MLISPAAVFASASQAASGSHPKLGHSILQTPRNESWPSFDASLQTKPNASARTELGIGVLKKPLEISAQNSTPRHRGRTSKWTSRGNFGWRGTRR